jgi:hypothetical protein
MLKHPIYFPPTKQHKVLPACYHQRNASSEHRLAKIPPIYHLQSLKCYNINLKLHWYKIPAENFISHPPPTAFGEKLQRSSYEPGMKCSTFDEMLHFCQGGSVQLCWSHVLLEIRPALFQMY